MARIKKGVKVKIESIKHFTSQQEARDYAISVLQSGVTYLEIDDWYVEVDDPEPVSPEPPEPKPKQVQKKHGPKPGPKTPVPGSGKKKRAQFRYPSGLRNFCIKNIDRMKNQELLETINKEFDLDMDYNRLMSYLKYNNIKRSKESHQKKEKDLATLPPEDNY